MTGAVACRNVGKVFPVVSAVAKIVCKDGIAFATHVDEALLDSNPAKTESPLSSLHQPLCSTKNGIDDHARRELDVHGRPGMPPAHFGDSRILLFFDCTLCL